jgi:predicted DNA-binding transcriptional regulator AlpA
MDAISTRQAAKRLGITEATLSRYITAKKVPTPKILNVGRFRVHAWTEAEIEAVRKLLPKIANGRKTRYQKLREKQNKTPAKASQSKPKPHKKK